MDWLNFLGTRARNISAIIALTVTIAGALWWAVGDEFVEAIRTKQAQERTRCVRIPATGHVIESAASGEWATVIWHDIERTRNCGRPELSAVISNGDGIYHDAELSISGVNLEIGRTDSFKYRFKIPDNASAGRAWFRVTLDYHNEGRSVNSPRIYFTILDKDQ